MLMYSLFLQIVDTITVSGPRAPLGYPLVDRLHTTGDSERIVLPKCGEGRVTHRTDLILTAAKKGLTASVTKPLEKVPQGIEQIIAYAWEKCSK